MNIEEFHSYCTSLKAVTEEFPFDEKTLVFKVAGKLFALCDVDTFSSINLKCDPELAIHLREQYPAVVAGYHMNKKHWNTIYLDGSVSDQMIYMWIKNSYDLVVENLPKKVRIDLELI